MLDDFVDGVQEAWSQFLDWSESAGLPLKSAATALEEKGVPALPVFAALALVLVGVGVMVFAPSVVSPFFPAENATVIVELQSRETGTTLALAGVEVALSQENVDEGNYRGFSDGDGIIAFRNEVVPGSYSIKVVDDRYSGSATVEAQSGKAVNVAVEVIETLKKKIKLNVDVQRLGGGAGPDNASIALLDSSGNEIGSTFGSGASFDVDQRANYSVRVSAPGWNENRTFVATASGDGRQVVFITPKPGFDKVDVLFLAIDGAQRGKYVANASIVLRDAVTGKDLFSPLLTTSDGGTMQTGVSVGQKLVVVANAEGYEPFQMNFTPGFFNNSLSLYMERVDPSGLKKLTVTTLDSSGNPVRGATVQLHQNNVKTGYPAVVSNSKGVAEFRVREGYYLATAYASSFLPAFESDVPSGGAVELRLENALGNSGQVKVAVVDEAKSALSEASVSLYREGGVPLGMPERVTGIDGSVVFSDVPYETIFARASRNGRSGESSRVLVAPLGETGLNATLINVALVPQKGGLSVLVRDHFSRKLVHGAVVEVSTRESASCVAQDGSCEVNVLEGFGRVRVTANGYNDYSSSEVEILPNARSRLDVELVSKAVSTGVKASFVGLSDAAGRKVNSLGPSSAYTATLLITAPPQVNFSKAVLHFRVGKAESAIESEPVFITGYDVAGGRATAGSSYSELGISDVSNESNAPVSPEVLPDTGEYKWVTFEFSKFSGTREIAINLRTRQATNGTATFGWRTSFTTPNETLRDPADAEAGVSKDESLAAVNSKAYSISFEGTCEEDLCIQSIVSSKRGKFSENFEAQVPETFQLRVKALSTSIQTLSVAVTAGGDAVKLLDAQSGPVRGALVNTETGPELSVTTQPGLEEAVFSLQALRPSNGIELQILASSKGTPLMQQTIAGRIVTERNASLSVRAAPDSIKALSENKVLFTVRDEYGNPIQDAHIVIGAANDALGTSTDLLGTGGEGGGKDGRYFVEGIRPTKVGAVFYSVEATGFSTFKSRLRVDAKQIIEVQPTDTIEADASSKDNESAIPISIQNLLDNDVNVQAALLFSKPGEITEAFLDSSEFKLEPSGARQLQFSAKIADAVLSISDRDRTLSEKPEGRVILTAKVGRSTQTVEIPFKITSTFEQKDIDDLWTIGTDIGEAEFEFEIDLDKKEPQSARVNVFNTAPYPLLLNHQEPGSPDWLSVSPLSMIMPPMDSGTYDGTNSEVLIEAGVPRKFASDDCLFEGDDVQKAEILFYASYAGIVSKKNASVTLKLYSSSNCAPDGGLEISLPVDASFTLPANAKHKINEDGSFATLLPTGERLLFSADAMVDDTSKRVKVILPSNASMTLPPKLVSVTSASKFEFWLPFEVKYELGPMQQKINNADGTTTIILGSQDKITFPSGTSFPQSTEKQGGLVATVPANGHVKVDKATIETSTCATSIGFPESASFSLPSGATTETTGGNTRAKLSDCDTVEVTAGDGTFVRLPSSNTFDVESPSTIQPTTDGGFTAKIAAGKPFKFYSCSAKEGSINEYALKFPIQTTILVSKKATVEGGTISFGGCEKIERVDERGAKTSFPSARVMTVADAQTLPQDENGNTPIIVPANSEITLEACPCVPGTSESVTISYAYKYLQLANDTIFFNLSDSQKEQEKDACLYNKGTDSIKIAATANVDVAGLTNLGAAGFIDDKDMRFAKEFERTNLMPPTEQGTPCLPYRIKAKLPANLVDEFGCIKDRKQSSEYVGKIRFDGESTKGIKIGPAYAPMLTATISVKASSQCWYEARKNVHLALQEFYVNYDSQQINPRTNEGMILAFKDKGHERFLTLINNREEDVEVTLAGGRTNEGEMIKCFNSAYGTGAFATEHIPASSSRVIRCQATGAGSAEGRGPASGLVFTAFGPETNKTTKRVVRAVIYAVEGDEAKNLYYATPIGELAPIEDTAVPLVPAKFKEPPLKDAVTGAIVPETKSPTTGENPQTGLPTGTQTQTGAVQTKAAQTQKRSISFAEEPTPSPTADAQTGGPSSSSSPSSAKPECDVNTLCGAGKACSQGKCVDLASPDVQQALQQSPYPNAAPEGTVVATAPDGVALPATNVTGTAVATADDYFTVCEKNYCNYEQSKRAYSSFLTNVRAYITWIASDEKNFSTRLNLFCQRSRKIFGGDGAYSKVMALQLANTVQKIDFLENDARSALALDPETPVQLSYGDVGADREFRGCGTYEIRATLDVCKTGATTMEDWKKTLGVEIRAEKIHECATTLANAPLFIGTNSSDLGITIGRRIVHWPSELTNFDDYSSKFSATNPLTWISGVWALGPYGRGYSKQDAVQARELYTYIYQNSTEKARYATPAQDYDEARFCTTHGTKQLAVVGGASILGTIAISAGSVLLAAPTGGTSAIIGAIANTVSARLAATAPIAGAVCLGNVGGRGAAALVDAPAGGGCAAINDCIKAVMWMGTASVAPTTKQLTQVPTKDWKLAWTQAGGRATWKRLGLYAGASAVTGAITSYSPETEGASVPLVIAAGMLLPQRIISQTYSAKTKLPYVKPTLTKLTPAQADQATQEMQAQSTDLVRQTNPGPNFNPNWPSNLLPPANPQLGLPPASGGLPPASGGLPPASGGLPPGTGGVIATSAGQEISTSAATTPAAALPITGFATATRSLPMPLYAGEAETLVLGPDGVYYVAGEVPTTPVTPRLTAATTAATGGAAAGAATQVADEAATKTTLLSKFSNLLGSGKAKALAGLKALVSKNGLSSIAQLASLLMFDVNVRPVQAELDPRISSHMVVYHMERKRAGWKLGLSTTHQPSAYILCTSDGKGGCDEDNTFYLADLCNSDRNACLYSMPLSTTSKTAPQGYNLIFVKNDVNVDSKQFLDSVFNPNTPPLAPNGAIFDGGQLSGDSVKRLKGQRDDTGSGKATVFNDGGTANEGEVNILDVPQEGGAAAGPAGGAVDLNAPE
ncbi:MAG: Ig-like domain-containing protein [Candidatus Micrarchaeia archaeon]|jgi:hypothetical protein